MNLLSLPFKILPDSRLLLYTDGLTDAFPTESEGFNTFGVRDLCVALEHCGRKATGEALEHLFGTSHAFTRGTGRHDETSVVLVERFP